MSGFFDRESFIAYYLQINQEINLTAIRDPAQFYLKHIVDSLMIKESIQIQDHRKVCDVGTGGGFPLLVLAISYPQTQFRGLDSTHKKLKIIAQIAEHFHIDNVHTIRSRAEKHHQVYDLITCRAVAHSTTLLPLILHLVKPQGYIVLYKLYSVAEEEMLYEACRAAQLKLISKHYYSLYDQDCKRVVYTIQSKKIS